MGVISARKNTLGWIGFFSFLTVGLAIFLCMMVYGALTVSPNYPQDSAGYIIGLLYSGLLLSLLGTIAFATMLYRTYDLHLLRSVGDWLRHKGESPWQ